MKKSKRVLGAKPATTTAPDEMQEAATTLRRAEVSVREAKDQLSALLRRVAAGEEIVITSDGEPKAMLVRHRPIVVGKPWTSLAAFRATMPVQPDSARLIWKMRDDSY